MFRQLYQTRVPDHLVQKLDNTYSGISPLVQTIEKEYGVRTTFNRNRQMVLVSPSVEMLELVLDTLEGRYNCEKDAPEDNSKLEVLPELIVKKEAVTADCLGDEVKDTKNNKPDNNVNNLNIPEDHIPDIETTVDNVINQASDTGSKGVDDNAGTDGGQEGGDKLSEIYDNKPVVTEIKNKHSLTLKRYPTNAISRFPELARPRLRATNSRRSNTRPLKLGPENTDIRSSLKGTSGKERDTISRQKTVSFEA